MTRPCKVDRPIETLISKHNLLSAFNGYCKINVIVPQMSSCTPHNLRDENKKSKPIYRPPKEHYTKPINIVMKKNIPSPGAQCSINDRSFLIPCPLCNKLFPMKEIEKHASICNIYICT